ncbi:MAG: hypothetical protein ACN0LA_01400 [Candidatus Longimicrobiales bacterium M2_2A_002]
MFFRRGVAEDDRWLEAKMWLFSIGALTALVGMLLENDWVMGAAAIFLLAGFLLRFVDGSDDREDPAGGQSPHPDADDGPTSRRDTTG